jgi:hypothetical protein
VTNVERRFRSRIRPIEWLDRNPWGDVHDDTVTFSLTAPIGLDMLAGHLTGHWRFATDRDSSAVARHAISADLYDSGCSVLAAVTFPDQVVL